MNSLFKTKSFIFILSLVLILGFSIFISIYHFYYGIKFAILNNSNFTVFLLIDFQLLIEFIVVLHSFVMLMILIPTFYNHKLPIQPIEIDSFPNLDIFIPVKNIEVLRIKKIIKAILKSSYDHNRLFIYLADDSTDKSLIKELLTYCNSINNLFLIHSDNNKYYKAGMVNQALKEAKSEFVIFLDYDQIPTINFFKHAINGLQHNLSIDFIQFKQKYTNLISYTHIWSAFLYMQYFEIFEVSRQKTHQILFAGSTACFRRKSINDIGGIPNRSFTEDNDLSIKFISSGKLGMYYNEIGSFGEVPLAYRTQIAQLWRWSHGAAHSLRINLRGILKSKRLNVFSKISIISSFAIPIIISLNYIYIVTFIYLILSHFNSLRWELFGLNTVIFPPILLLITFIFYGLYAIFQNNKDEMAKISLRKFPALLIHTFVRYNLTLFSGIYGFFKILTPSSIHSEWNPRIHIMRNSIISFFIGSIMVIFSVFQFLKGYSSSLVILLISLTLLVSLPISLYYDNKYPLEG